MKCIYDIPSQNQKSHLQKSDEHIFPQVIGGFAVKKNVCETCNDKLGIELDSSFKKSIYIIKALNKLKLSTKKKIHRNVKLSFERNGKEIPAYFNNSDVLTGGVQDYEEFLEVPNSLSFSHIRKILEKKINEHNCTSDFCEEDYVNAPYDLHIPIMDSSKSLFLFSFVKRRGNETNLKYLG
ncbi:MAG: HNH endonuclease [bacterium]|nr:HNH endonuclease [bacterium]